MESGNGKGEMRDFEEKYLLDRYKHYYSVVRPQVFAYLMYINAFKQAFNAYLTQPIVYMYR